MNILQITLADLGIDSGTQRLLNGSTQIAQTVVTTEVQGFAELEAALDALPEKLARKTLIPVVREGSKLFQTKAQELAPADPEIPLGHPEWRTMRLKDGIKVIVTVKNLGAAGAIVRGEIALDKKHAFFGRFVEFGHLSANSRQVAPHPYMRPAYESTKYPVLELVKNRLALALKLI